MTATARAAAACLARTLGVLGTCVLAGGAFAQTPPATPMPHDEAAPANGAAAAPWAQANAESMQRMHDAMMNASGGATEDEAFVRGMLPHHQGAVDMARTELQYGHDPEIKRLAARIVAAQQAEIREMSAWLARHR